MGRLSRTNCVRRLFFYGMRVFKNLTAFQLTSNLNRFAHTCSALIASGISVSDFSAFFLPRLEPLVSDPVVNVRIAASRTVRALCMTGMYKNRQGMSSFLLVMESEL